MLDDEKPVETRSGSEGSESPDDPKPEPDTPPVKKKLPLF